MSAIKGCALHFDCFSGVAGDMTIAALIDLGVPEEVVRDAVAQLPIDRYEIAISQAKRGALVGTKFDVHVDDHDHDHGGHAHRHWREIRAMLEKHLEGETRFRAISMFEYIATVEARMHGVTIDDVAFHEVGAIDSIVDIVGTAAALTWLAPARITSRRVPLGGGSVKTAHGTLPVPAPATLALLAGADVETGGDVELTTPTGAAILAANVTEYGTLPPMTVVAVGLGAGTRELGDRPNLLRLVAGRPIGGERAAATEGELCVIETNLDDMPPELCEPLSEALFAAGALDVWFTPIMMKKGRPAFTVSALAPLDDREAVSRACLRESTTLGVRHYPVTRTVLARRFVEVDTPYGKVPVKVGGEGDEILTASPEYEVCRRLAREADVPVKQVYAAALAAFYRRP
jgi:hypothetical protein